MSLPHAIVLLVALQRLAELFWSRRNARRLLATGGVEHGAGHHGALVLVHGGWLAAMAVFVPADAPVIWPLLAAYLALQVGRLWVIASLGRFWTTRVITVPGAPLVRRGPYRWLRHPNYAIVVAEVALLPLALGAWEVALIFSLANGALLAQRIRVEDAALAPRRAGTRA